MRTLQSMLTAFCLLVYLGATAQEAVTEEDYERAAQFLYGNTYGKVYRSAAYPNWLDDGRFYYSVNTADGRKYVLIDPKKKDRTEADSLGALLEEVPENTRRSRTEIVSPDGSKAVFIRDWNLWVRDMETNKEKQLTFDGKENFGYATDNAGWKHSDRPIVLWSPDSRKLATFQQDQRHVSDMYLVKTTVGAPELQAWKYPLPEDEEIIQIHRVIIEVDEPKVIRLKMDPDARRGTLCDDIACTGSFDDNVWNEDASELMFVSSSRDHKSAKLRIANAATGEVREIFEETVDTQYESGQGAVNWRWLPDTDEVIWYSERSDWGHLYLYDATSGELKNQITTGDFVVTQLLKVDEDKRMLYFLANGGEEGRDPYFTHFYSIRMDGKKLDLLTPEDAYHQVSLSPDGEYFVDNYSQMDVPNVAKLRTMSGKEVMTLEETDISELEATGWKPATPITVKSRDGRWDLFGVMFTPTNLDEDMKYPVVNYIYPGPQGGGVGRRSFSPSRSDHQALAELGFVVVVIDGTCNPGRSKSFHDVCYGNMADNTLEDQISGIRQLAERYPFIDLDRVGIWGHSGGGFATAAALFRYPEFYKVGVSQSGNHDNRNYEDDWGERYIGLIQQNEDGTTNYSVQANQEYADNLMGKLLIAHGNMDDNVPPYNTYLVVDALISANKDFDMIIYPNARHGYGRDNYYMTRRRWDYFVRHLKGVEPPKEFDLRPQN